MKTKKLSVFFLIGLFLLMLFSPETVATGAANGLLLWYRQVLPVLFPFLLITGLLIRTESISLINHTLSPILKPFLGISENASFSVVCGFLCGFPVGAKSCSDLTDKGKISSAEGEYLLSFCNNVSPAFLTGYVAVQSLKQPEMAQICLLFPILAALCCSFLFRRWYLPRNPFAVVEEQADPRQFLPFSEALDESILSACDSITKIGGYMIVFSVLISFMAELSFQNFFWKLLLLPGVSSRYGALFFWRSLRAFPDKMHDPIPELVFSSLYSRKADYRNGNQPVRFLLYEIVRIKNLFSLSLIRLSGFSAEFCFQSA